MLLLRDPNSFYWATGVIGASSRREEAWGEEVMGSVLLVQLRTVWCCSKCPEHRTGK